MVSYDGQFPLIKDLNESTIYRKDISSQTWFEKKYDNIVALVISRFLANNKLKQHVRWSQIIQVKLTVKINNEVQCIDNYYL